MHDDDAHELRSITEAVIMQQHRTASPLGEAVKLLRQTRRWSQQELADKAGVGLRTVHRLEASPTHRNTADIVRRVAEAFELHQTELLIFQSSTPPPPLLHGTREQRVLRRLWVALVKKQPQEKHAYMRTLQQSLTAALAQPPAGLESVQLVTNPRLQPLAHLVRALRTNDDSMLLVLCSHAHDLSPEVRDCDRVVVWGDKMLQVAHQRMPSTVAAVVFVTFPDHRGTGNVTRQARAQGAAIWHHTVTTRTVHELCVEAGLLASGDDAHNDHDNDDDTMSDLHTDNANWDPKQNRVRGGVLQTFLAKNATWFPTSPVAEITRLTQLALQERIPTTQASVAQLFYKTRREMKQRQLQPQPKLVAPPVVEPVASDEHEQGSMTLATVVEASSSLEVVAAVPASASPLAPSAATLQQELADVQQMLADSIASQQLIAESLAKLAPKIAEVFAANAETEALRHKLSVMQRTFSTLFEGAAAGDK